MKLPQSIDKNHNRENFTIFDFELSDEDMEKIKAMDENKGLFVVHEDPEFVKLLHSRKLHD